MVVAAAAAVVLVAVLVAVAAAAAVVMVVWQVPVVRRAVAEKQDANGVWPSQLPSHDCPHIIAQLKLPLRIFCCRCSNTDGRT